MTTIALWFLGIVFAIIFIVILAIVYSRYKELKEKEKKQQALGTSVREKQKAFRTLLQGLITEKLIAAPHKQGIMMLINNYFVYQPINDINVRHFEELYSSLVDSIAKIKEAPTEHKLEVAVALHELAAELPISPSDYSARFYLDVAPILVDQVAVRVDELLIESQQTAMSEEEEEEELTLASDETDNESDQISAQETKSDGERKVTLVTREHMSIR